MENRENEDWRSVDMGWGIVSQPVWRDEHKLGFPARIICRYFVYNRFTKVRTECVLYEHPITGERGTMPISDFEPYLQYWLQRTIEYDATYDSEVSYDPDRAFLDLAGVSDWMDVCSDCSACGSISSCTFYHEQTREAPQKKEGYHKWQSRARAIHGEKLATRKVANMLSRGKAKARPKR